MVSTWGSYSDESDDEEIDETAFMAIGDSDLKEEDDTSKIFYVIQVILAMLYNLPGVLSSSWGTQRLGNTYLGKVVCLATYRDIMTCLHLSYKLVETTNVNILTYLWRCLHLSRRALVLWPEINLWDPFVHLDMNDLYQKQESKWKPDWCAIGLTTELCYYILNGCCNGFIGLMTNIYDINTSVYISNPVLEKSVTRRFGDRHEVSALEVYTPGVDEKWRNLGQVPNPVWHDFGHVCVNGALHWMDPVNKDSIYSFDIETEKLKSVPVPGPPGLVFPFKYLTQAELQRSTCPPLCLTLVELGNCPCLTDASGSIFRHIDIWWMKEYGIAKSWTEEHILTCLGPAGFGLDICYPNYLPILVWKDKEILMQGKKGAQLFS
ncbi:hypothetical protein BC332_27785 [Capsicum chinense]|nr:hypothetical protein BC332_27785 [Capsicum chinense]